MKNMSRMDKLRWALGEYGRTNLWLYATSGAYYLFFSLGPLLVILLGLLPYMPFSEEALMDAVLGHAPGPFRELIEGLVDGLYAGSTTAIGLGALVELWSAGKVFSLILRTIEQIYDGQTHGSFLRRRLLGAVYTLALIVLILGNMILLFTGEKILDSIGLMSKWSALWTLLIRGREIFFFLVVTAVNALLFAHVPQRKLSYILQLPGAAFSAAAWLIFSHIYSWAVSSFGFYSIYGGLAVVIISLFWMYASLFLLFLGAWLNTLIEKWPLLEQ